MTHGVIGVAEDTGIRRRDRGRHVAFAGERAVRLRRCKHELERNLEPGRPSFAVTRASVASATSWPARIPARRRAAFAEAYVHEHGRKQVGEVMTRDVETIGGEPPSSAQAVDRMICRSIKRLAVLRARKCRRWRHLAAPTFLKGLLAATPREGPASRCRRSRPPSSGVSPRQARLGAARRACASRFRTASPPSAAR